MTTAKAWYPLREESWHRAYSFQHYPGAEPSPSQEQKLVGNYLNSSNSSSINIPSPPTSTSLSHSGDSRRNCHNQMIFAVMHLASILSSLGLVAAAIATALTAPMEGYVVAEMQWTREYQGHSYNISGTVEVYSSSTCIVNAPRTDNF
jgi:hypothetical protein